MEEKHWNSDMAYAFSVHRLVLWIFGSWPLQRISFSSRIRWILITIIELSMTVPAVMEVFVFHVRHQVILENLFILECGILALAKNFLSRIHVKKLATNIECAMIDWLTVLREDSSYPIMKKYARIGRLVTLYLFNSMHWCYCFYYLYIVFYPYSEFNSSTDNVMIRRNFLIPFSWLADDMSDSVYLAVFLLQFSQTYVVGIRQIVVDSFFFSIVMHICGQLQVLSMKLKNLGRYNKLNVDYKKELISLVRRHCQLMEIVKNVEDTFNVIILLQILLSVILIAVGCVRLVLSVAEKNNVQMLQNFIIIIFLIFECSFYTYAGDLLQTCGEQIFFDIYDAPWYRFTPAASRNLQIIMMQANIPLRITGGKFIDISCKTMMNILKSAASYVSVLSTTTEN